MSEKHTICISEEDLLQKCKERISKSGLQTLDKAAYTLVTLLEELELNDSAEKLYDYYQGKR